MNLKQNNLNKRKPQLINATGALNQTILCWNIEVVYICLTQIHCVKWLQYAWQTCVFVVIAIWFTLRCWPICLAFSVHMSVWCSVFQMCTKFVYIYIIHPSSLYIYTCTVHTKFVIVIYYIKYKSLEFITIPIQIGFLSFGAAHSYLSNKSNLWAFKRVWWLRKTFIRN